MSSVDPGERYVDARYSIKPFLAPDVLTKTPLLIYCPLLSNGYDF